MKTGVQYYCFGILNQIKKTVYQLPENQEYYYYLISPDKKSLALTEGKTSAQTSKVFVLTAHGQKEADFIVPGDWTLFDWLNNENLLIRQIRLRGEELDLIAVNPFTGEQQFLKSDFPNLYSNETLVSWGALTIFDPTASFVIYPQRKGNDLFSILWDIRANREVAHIFGGSWPKWAPDGNRWLIVADPDTQLPRRFNEIFIVTTKGEVVRSTFFKDNLENDLISMPVWSPNSRYVAFWLSVVVPVESARLAVLDTETSTIELYCKEVNPFPYRFGEHNTLGYAYYQVNAASPIWSPDNQYLLIEDYQDFTSDTYLFDIQNHAITQITEGTRPVGWMRYRE
jgi:hypothetical protein